MKVEEIDKKIAELQAQRDAALQKEREEARKAEYEEARDLLEKLVPMVVRLHELGYLPPRLETALRDSTEKFNPGMYIKRPKAIRVIAD